MNYYAFSKKVISYLSTKLHYSVDKARLKIVCPRIRGILWISLFYLSLSLSFNLVLFYVISTEIFLCHIDRAERVEISIFYDVSEKISKFVG